MRLSRLEAQRQTQVGSEVEASTPSAHATKDNVLDAVRDTTRVEDADNDDFAVCQAVDAQRWP